MNTRTALLNRSISNPPSASLNFIKLSVAIVTAVVAVLDQRPRFFLFLLFCVDELLDIGVPIFERVHLRRAPRFAAAFHHVCDLVVHFQERQWPARFAAAAELFPCRS